MSGAFFPSCLSIIISWFVPSGIGSQPQADPPPNHSGDFALNQEIRHHAEAHPRYRNFYLAYKVPPQRGGWNLGVLDLGWMRIFRMWGLRWALFFQICEGRMGEHFSWAWVCMGLKWEKKRLVKLCGLVTFPDNRLATSRQVMARCNFAYKEKHVIPGMEKALQEILGKLWQPIQTAQ